MKLVPARTSQFLSHWVWSINSYSWSGLGWVDGRDLNKCIISDELMVNIFYYNITVSESVPSSSTHLQPSTVVRVLFRHVLSGFEASVDCFVMWSRFWIFEVQKEMAKILHERFSFFSIDCQWLHLEPIFTYMCPGPSLLAIRVPGSRSGFNMEPKARIWVSLFVKWAPPDPPTKACQPMWTPMQTVGLGKKKGHPIRQVLPDTTHSITWSTLYRPCPEFYFSLSD